LIAAIPADSQEDDGGLVVPPLERRFMLLQEYDSRRVIDEPKQDNSSKAILATEPNLLSFRDQWCVAGGLAVEGHKWFQCREPALRGG
jgi:hypothetical protein